jgi:hypothetical protein
VLKEKHKQETEKQKDINSGEVVIFCVRFVVTDRY